MGACASYNCICGIHSRVNVNDIDLNALEPADYNYEEAALNPDIVISCSSLAELDGCSAHVNELEAAGSYVILPSAQKEDLNKNIMVAVGGYNEDANLYYVASDGDELNDQDMTGLSRNL